jgi:predicted dehydrogenase
MPEQLPLGDEFSFQARGHLTAYGDQGILTADMPNFPPGPANGIVLERNGVKQSVAAEGDGISPAAAFVACILDGAPNIAPVADAANVVALIQGAYRSVAERRIVRLDENL